MLHTNKYEILNYLDSGWCWSGPTSIFTGASSLSMFHNGLCEPYEHTCFTLVMIGTVSHLSMLVI